MKNLKQITALLIFSSAFTLCAQEKAKEVKKGEIKVVVVNDENGNVTKTEETFSLEDQEKVQKLLKEQGIEIDLGSLGKGSNVEVFKSDDGEEVELKKGHFKNEFKVYKTDKNENLEEILRETGITIKMDSLVGENGFNVNYLTDDTEKDIVVKVVKEEEVDGEVEKDIQVFNFTTKSTNKTIDEQLLKELKKAAEEGDAEKIKELTGGDEQEVIILNDEDVKIENTPEENKVIVRTYEFNSDDEEGRSTMIFLKKESTYSAEKRLPRKIEESFDDNSSIQDLKLFPNPANDNFNMSFTSKEPKDYRLSITDSKGSKVFEKQLINFEGSFNESFDLSNYDNGVYLFNLFSEGEKISKQIIVQ